MARTGHCDIGAYQYVQSTPKPNLSIQGSDISISPENPTPNQIATVTASITNNGTAEADNVKVSLYKLDTLIDSTTISKLAEGASEDVQFDLSFPSTDAYLVTIKIDPDNTIDEVRKDDNQAGKIVMVGNPGSVPATIQVTASPVTACQGSAVAFSGQALYVFPSGGVQLTHPVQGGNVSVTIMDPWTGSSLSSYVGAYTDVNGNFYQPAWGPTADGSYKVNILVTDKTLTSSKSSTTILTISGACPTPTQPTWTPTPPTITPTPTTSPTPPTPPGPTPTPPDDVYIHSENIQFGKEPPMFNINEVFSIFAKIFHVGNSSVPDFQVKVYDIYPQSGTLHSSLIYKKTINFLPPIINKPIDLAFPAQVLIRGPHIIQIGFNPQIDQDTGNDAATRLIYVGSPSNIKITKTVTLETDADHNGIISPGDTLLYSLSYQNFGSTKLSNATIIDQMDYKFVVQPAQSDLSSNGSIGSDGNLVWNLGDLAAGQSGSVTYPVTIKPCAQVSSAAFLIVNNAFITTDEGDGGADNLQTAVQGSLCNKPPTVSVNGSYAVDEGGSVQLFATGSDPENGPLTYVWDLNNDGVFETQGQAAIFSAGSLDGPGTKTVKVKVTDNGNLTATDQTIVTIRNLAPIATLSAPATVDTRRAFSIALINPFDPSSADTTAGFRYSIDCGSGSGYSIFSYSSSLTCPAFTKVGTYAIGGKIKDKDNGISSYTGQVTVQATTTVVLRLIDSLGNGISGGTGQYYDGSWIAIPGTTDSSGLLKYSIPGEKTTLSFRMTYAGASKDISQNVLANPTVTFQTVKVTAELRNSGGSLIDTGTVQYYAGSWLSFGTTTGGRTTFELLPNTYSFRMIYAGASEDISQNIGTNSTVTFRTVKVTAELRNSANKLIDTGTVQYYAGSWLPFGTTTGGRTTFELLPNTYSFRMIYAGASKDISQNIATDSTVTFQTVKVTAELRNSDNSLIDTGTVQYYASSWLPFGTTSGGQTTFELLPNTYSFRMTYAGATKDISQNIASNSTVTFQTVKVTAELRNSTYNLIDTGTIQYYSGAWLPFGTTSGGQASFELLPNTYSFRMTYAGASEDISQNIGTSSTVTFRTVKVTAELRNSGGSLIDIGMIQYYAGSWLPFGTTSGGKANLELLPNTISFRMTYAGASKDISQNIATNPTVVFQTGKVVSASGKCTKYYAGMWRDFVNGLELLPVSYSFRFSDGTVDTSFTIASAVTNTIH